MRPTLFALLPLAGLLLCSACAFEGAGESSYEDGAASANEPFVAPPFAAEGTTARFGSGDLVVLMVVDRSGSMSSYFDGQPRWSVAQNALSKAIEGVENQLTIGAILFPSDGNCGVAPLTDASQIQFRAAGEFRPVWETSGVTSPNGATPLGLALERADESVQQLEASGSLVGRRLRVVIVTDGEPTCGENPEALIARSDALRSRGHEVEVLGLPGSQTAALLLHRLAGLDPSTLPEDAVPESTWTEGSSGYVAPSAPEDVDDSTHMLIR